VLNKGFEFVAFARVLVKNPDFINKLWDNVLISSECYISNYSIQVTYRGMATCILDDKNPDPEILKMAGDRFKKLQIILSFPDFFFDPLNVSTAKAFYLATKLKIPFYLVISQDSKAVNDGSRLTDCSYNIIRNKVGVGLCGTANNCLSVI
jgi:hypothetical protein